MTAIAAAQTASPAPGAPARCRSAPTPIATVVAIASAMVVREPTMTPRRYAGAPRPT